MNIPSPEDWGRDKLGRVIDMTRMNTLTTFVHNREAYDVLASINALFETLNSNLANTKKWFVTLFVPRCHSAFIATTRLALSGQNPEAYILMRGCLEYALYAFYIHRDPDSAQTFLHRHNDEASLRKMKKEFRPKAMLDVLRAANTPTAEVATKLYEWTINYGAHPNPHGMLTAMSFEKKNGGMIAETEYFNNDPVIQGLCLKNAARVGVYSLEIFRLILPERFALLSLDLQLDRYKETL